MDLLDFLQFESGVFLKKLFAERTAMGVKGLHGYVQNCCPDIFTTVNLKEMAKAYMNANPGQTPTIVVDAMSCISFWYTPDAWVHGGQWLELLSSLANFIETFKAAGIKLVFIYDGVVEKKKRNEWVRRRLENNKEIANIFQHIKTYGQQPGRDMFYIPSGLSTYTRSALKSLGQEVISSQREGDYEVAAYGLQNKCLGILGQDTDYFIFNTVPYFSISKLCLNQLVTIMFSQEKLCRHLGLGIADLPVFACLLGNDIIPEEKLESFHRKCTMVCRGLVQGYSRRATTIAAVAKFLSRVPHSQRSWNVLDEIVPGDLDRALLHKAVKEYVLPGQSSPWLSHNDPPPEQFCDAQVTPTCLDQEILQMITAERRQGKTLIYKVMVIGEVECSNSLEDETNRELPGQALIYRPVRQHMYAILLGSGKGTPKSSPSVKEWCVYPGNPLTRPEIVHAVPLDIPGGTPSVRDLWLSKGPEVETLRWKTFLACYHAEDFMDELRALEPSVAAVCTMLIYLFSQVASLSLEDLSAFLALTLCMQGKSAEQLRDLQLSRVDSRAVHLGALFIRGISTLKAVSSTCGSPFKTDELMPWKVFDGKLFHQKYLQACKGCPTEELLEGNKSLLAQFESLKSLICAACAAKSRTIQSHPRGIVPLQEQSGQFPSTNRSYNHPYHNPSRSYQWRGSRPGSSGSQSYDTGRGHNSGNRFQRGRGFQFAPRWPQ